MTETSVELQDSNQPVGHSVSLEPDGSHQHWYPSRRVVMVLACQAFCVFIISLDMTILTPTLPTIAHAIDANATESFWIAASYLLANAVCQPMMAALADTFGRQPLFLGSVGIFTIGSLICATAPSVVAILVGRTVQGVGGGGIISVNLIILSDLIPLRQRPLYQGIIQLVFGLGTSIAPVLGGALIKTNWRWVFYINLPFCGIGLVTIPFCLRYQQPETSITHKLSSVDWVGSILTIVSSTSFLAGMSWGGNQFRWDSAAVLVPVFVGLAGVAFTVYYESSIAEKPFLRLSLFQHWSGKVAFLCTMLQGYLLFAMTYYLVIYLMVCKLYSPIMAGVGLLPFAVTVVPISGLTGVLITRLGHYRWAIWLGWTLSVLGCGLLIVLDINTPTGAWVLSFMCAGAGQGLLLIGHAVAIQASCSSEDAAHASSMYSFIRSFGLCLGVIIGGTIFQNFLRVRLRHEGLPASIASSVEAIIPTIQSLSDADQMRSDLQHAYAWALQMLFTTITGVGAVGLALSLTLGNYTLDTTLEEQHRLKE